MPFKKEKEYLSFRKTYKDLLQKAVPPYEQPPFAADLLFKGIYLSFLSFASIIKVKPNERMFFYVLSGRALQI